MSPGPERKVGDRTPGEPRWIRQASAHRNHGDGDAQTDASHSDGHASGGRETEKDTEESREAGESKEPRQNRGLGRMVVRTFRKRTGQKLPRRMRARMRENRTRKRWILVGRIETDPLCRNENATGERTGTCDAKSTKEC
eukprot:scaffold616_cov306-Pavlova_lutheri.AAC.41